MLGGTKIRLGRGDAAGGGVVLVPRAELCWMKGHMGRGGRATSEGWGMPHGISPPPPPRALLLRGIHHANRRRQD